MELASLGFGCALGAFFNFGFAILFAIYGVSPWWLLAVAFVANLFAQPLSVRNNLMEIALERGYFPRTVFAIWIMPPLVFFAIQLLVYWATKQAL